AAALFTRQADHHRQGGGPGGFFRQGGGQSSPALARQPGRVVGVGGAQAAFGHQPVGLARLQRRQGQGLGVERWQVAGFAQQQQLEGAQRGGRQRLGIARRQRMHQGGIGVEQARVGILARQQAQQQLVGVKARQQRIAARHHLPAAPLGHLERADLAVTTPGQQQR